MLIAAGVFALGVAVGHLMFYGSTDQTISLFITAGITLGIAVFLKLVE